MFLYFSLNFIIIESVCVDNDLSMRNKKALGGVCISLKDVASILVEKEEL